MIKLICGDNNYLSLNYLKQFRLNPHLIIDGENINLADDIINSLDNISLFSNEKTVIVKRFFKNSKKISIQKNLLNWLNKINVNNIDLIFWEDSEFKARKNKKVSKIKDINKTKSKTTSLIKFIEENGEINDFKLLDNSELNNWISLKLKELNIKFNTSIINSIINRIGNNQFIIENELNKISLYLKYNNINEFKEEHISLLSLYEPDKTVWDLTDAISKKEKYKAIQLSDILLSNPYDFPMVIGATLKNLMQLLFIKKYSYDKNNLSKALSINPYNYYRILSAAKNFSENELKNFINKLINLDYYIKNGLIDVRIGFTLFIISL